MHYYTLLVCRFVFSLYLFLLLFIFLYHTFGRTEVVTSPLPVRSTLRMSRVVFRMNAHSCKRLRNRNTFIQVPCKHFYSEWVHSEWINIVHVNAPIENYWKLHITMSPPIHKAQNKDTQSYCGFPPSGFLPCCSYLIYLWLLFGFI